MLTHECNNHFLRMVAIMITYAWADAHKLLNVKFWKRWPCLSLKAHYIYCWIITPTFCSFEVMQFRCRLRTLQYFSNWKLCSSRRHLAYSNMVCRDINELVRAMNIYEFNYLNQYPFIIMNVIFERKVFIYGKMG